MMFPPVIMLHQVSDDPELNSLKPYCITHRTFLQLLDYLEENAVQTLTFTSLVKNNEQGKRRRNAVILTFDDCAKSLIDFAVPELIKRKMQAVFYMPTAHLGGFNSWDADEGRARIPLMNETDLQQLHTQGMEIGSHANHHVKMKMLKSRQELEAEVSVSKKILEQIISAQVVSFAYPYGSVPEGYRELLQKAGYPYGVSIFHPYHSRFALRRFIYHDGDTRESLKKKLTIYYSWYRKLTDPFKNYEKNG